MDTGLIRIDPRRWRMLPCLLLWGLPSAPTAEPMMVLGYGTGTVPAATVIGEELARFAPEPIDPMSSSARPEDALSSWADTALNQLGWPVTTSLVPGREVTIRRLAGWSGPSVCVVGRDPTSLHWLRQHRSRLHQAAMTCIVVQARSPAEVRPIRRLAAPVPIEALPGEAVAAEFGLTTVPALLIPGRGEP